MGARAPAGTDSGQLGVVVDRAGGPGPASTTSRAGLQRVLGGIESFVTANPRVVAQYAFRPGAAAPDPSAVRYRNTWAPLRSAAMKINRRVAVAALIAGFLLGFLDFVWIKYMPFPLAGLGNSIGVWAVAAFLFTYYTRWSMPRSIIGAVVMLVGAVPSYYAAAALIQDDAWSNVWNTVSFVWMGLGVVAGIVFGGGGVVARRPGRWRLPALALPAAVLLAEMIVDLSRLGDPNYRTAELVEYAVVLVVLAVLVIVVVGRTWRDRTLALAYAVPLSGAGYLLMIATAFGGS